MQTNPFLPPTSTPPSEANGLAVTPIFIGVLVGAGSAYVVMSLSSLTLFWWLVSSGTPLADLYRRIYGSVPYLAFAHTAGFLCMVLGGYWTARMAGDRSTSVALIAGAIFTAFTVVQYVTPYALPIPLWSQAVSVLAPIPGYLLGACLFRRGTWGVRPPTPA